MAKKKQTNKPKPKRVKEVTIETYLREQVEANGGKCEKFISPGRRDVPDRLVTWPGTMHLVETKAPKKKPREGQIRDHKERRKLGVHVLVIDSREKVDRYIKHREKESIWIAAFLDFCV